MTFVWLSTELGSVGVDDYSRPDAATHAIQYTDYRRAHTTSKLADEEEFAAAAARSRRELSSIDALQKHRAALSYSMSDAERSAQEARARDREADEARRRSALSAYDRMIETVHGRAASLLGGCRARDTEN